jgi:hypothetical protein
MYTDWVIVFSTTQLYEAEIVKNILAENSIECITMNKRDSVYMFGEVEVYVTTDQVLQAKQIIARHQGE